MQDPLDFEVEIIERVQRSRKAVPQRGYLRQAKMANPPVCMRCVAEYNAGTRVRAANRVAYRVWLPEWEAPELMCGPHGADFGVQHGLTRASARSTK